MQLALGLLVLISVGLAGASLAGTKLQKLCAGSKSEIRLETGDDLLEILAELDKAESDGPPGCDRPVIEALEALREITSDKVGCTMRKAKGLTEFVTKYLRAPSKSQIPQPLADFAIAYGMQASSVCQHEMLEQFSPTADARLYHKLGPERHKHFEAFKQKLVESPIGVALRPIIKTGEVILPADLIQLIPEMGDALKLKLEVELPGSRQGPPQALRDMCRNFLQPLYEPLLLPLAHLLRAGFKTRLASEFKRSHMKAEGRFWSTAVFVCEALKMIELKVDGEQAAGAEPEPAASQAELRHLSEEVAKLEAAEDDNDDEEGAQLAGATPIEAYQSSREVGQLIASKSVRSLVKAYDANKSEVERLRRRILSRGARIMRIFLRGRKQWPKMSRLMSSIKVKEGAVDAKEFEKAKGAIIKLLEPTPESMENTAVDAKPQSGNSLHERKGMSLYKGFQLFWTVVFSSVTFSMLVTILVIALLTLLPCLCSDAYHIWEAVIGLSAFAVIKAGTLGLVDPLAELSKPGNGRK